MEVGLTVSDSFYNFWQDFEAAYSTVYLTSCMIRDNNSFAAYFICFDRVGGTLDSFDDERPSIGDPLPLLVGISLNG